MSSITPGWIVDQVRKAILDENDVQYTDTQMIGLYNACTRRILSLKPTAYVNERDLALVAGTEQTIPTDQPIWLELLNPICNMGTDGSTEGLPVTEVDLAVFQIMVPTWRTDSANAVIQHVMRIPGVKEKFYVYPKSTGTNYLKAEGSALPTDVVYDADGDWENQAIALDDTYVNAYMTGMKYLAYGEDTDLPGNLQQNQLYYSRFQEAVAEGK